MPESFEEMWAALLPIGVAAFVELDVDQGRALEVPIGVGSGIAPQHCLAGVNALATVPRELAG